MGLAVCLSTLSGQTDKPTDRQMRWPTRRQTCKLTRSAYALLIESDALKRKENWHRGI